MIEFIDELPPVCRPRSRLFALQPNAVGTGKVESLTSYIGRLADAHSISAGHLVTEEIAPYFLKQGTLKTEARYWFAKFSSFNGNSPTAAEALAALTALTGRTDLKNVTMLFTSGFLAPTGLPDSKQKWCNKCLSESMDTAESVYYPLSWQLRSVQACSRHKIWLEKMCRHCRKAHSPLHRYSRPGFCPHCRQLLVDGSSMTQHDKQANDVSIFFASEAENLICAAADLQDHRPAFAENVDTLLGLFHGNVSALARTIHVSRFTIDHWIAGTQLPKLHSLLSLAFAFAVPAKELLTTPVVQLPKEVRTFDRGDIDFAKPINRKHDRAEIEAALNEAINNPKFPPPTLASICRKLGVHMSYVVKRFPVPSSKIKAEYAMHQSVHRKLRPSFVKTRVNMVVNELASKDIYPSQRLVNQALSPDYSLREPLAAEAWHEALEEWGYRT